MTVGAADFAFGNLAKNEFPPRPVVEHVRDFVDLRASHMVELQDYRVIFPAIDARMTVEMGKDLDGVLPHSGVHPDCGFSNVCRLVGLVVGLLIFAVARLAFRLKTVPMLREFGPRQVPVAVVASLVLHPLF
jgi:hypothetical protein